MMCPSNTARVEELEKEQNSLNHRMSLFWEIDNIMRSIKEGAANERADFLVWLKETINLIGINSPMWFHIHNKIRELEGDKA